MRTLFALVLIVCALPVIQSSENAFTLVRDGKPAATIVTARQPTKAAQLAAAELRWHVQQMTGAQLTITDENAQISGPVILIGDSAATRALGLSGATFKPQEYLVQIRSDRLVLLGNDKDDRGVIEYEKTTSYAQFPDYYDERGSLFAVYELLERYCGVRWFTATDLGTHFPQSKTLTVSGADTRRMPGFIYRGFDSILWADYDRSTGFWLDKSEEAKVTESIAWSDLQKQHPTEFYHAKLRAARLFMHRHRAGGERYAANHSFYGYYDRFWKKNPDVPQVFEAERPEFFAQGYTGKPDQMCYTNRGFINQVIQDANEFFGGKPKKHHAFAFGDYFALVPMDNGSYCKCADCQPFYLKQYPGSGYFSNGKDSDYIFTFANEIAREIKQTHPEKYLATLAYASYAHYPRTTKLESNIAVMMCLHVRQPYLTGAMENDMKIFKDWTRDKKRPTYVWLYYCFPFENTGYKGAWHCFPGFFGNYAARAYKLYHEHGVRGAFFNGLGQDWDQYVSMKMLMHPELDIDTVNDEYFRLYYGAAAEPMRKMHLRIEEVYCSPNRYPKTFVGHRHQTENVAWGYLGTADVMAELGGYMEQAKAAARTDRDKRAVAHFENETWRYMVEGRKKYMERAAAWYGGIPSRRVPALANDASGGSIKKIDWAQAQTNALWRSSIIEPTHRELLARWAHDGNNLYLRLEEELGEKTRQNYGGIDPADDRWEIALSGPAGGMQHINVSASGKSSAQSVEVTSELKDNTWKTSLKIPLTQIGADVKAGAVIRMNIIRRAKNGTAVWVPSPKTGAQFDPERMAALTLDPLEIAPWPRGEKQRTADGLVAHWDFDKVAYEKVPDRSGNALNGTTYNGPHPIKGVAGKALRFRHEEFTEVDCGNPEALNFNGPFSVEAWVNLADPSECGAIWGKGYEFAGGYSLHVRPDLTLWFEILGDDKKRFHYNPTDLQLSPGQWQHVVCTYDGKMQRIYLDGREAGAGQAAEMKMMQTKEHFRIGTFHAYTNFTGGIDEVSVFKRALSRDEVRQHYLSLKPK